MTHMLSIPAAGRAIVSAHRRVLALTMAAVLAGCASTPPAPTAAPAAQPLQQYMQEAAQALADGNNKERARELYRTAAKVYPTSKEPWVKLAEDYFEAANYGQAILAAQEVILRDPQDSLATSVLAVSGLRVSASALSALQQQKSTLTGGTRSEAETLARILREALGEPVLVPAPASAAASVPGPKTPPVRPPRPPKPVGASAAAASAPAVAVPAKQNAASDPFGILKK